MQIVIDIPDEQIEKSLAESKYIHENEGEKGYVQITMLYTNARLKFVDVERKTDFYSLTDKYTVLPKGHGRLIDADKLWDSYHDLDYDFYEALDSVDTIIEADTESEEI